jgi:hypothetical protein
MNIYNFLKDGELETIKKRVLDGEPFLSIGKEYLQLKRRHRSVLWGYMRSVRTPPLSNSSGLFGHKNEPYWTEDQIGIIPTYKWEDLSDEEKDFYNLKNKEKDDN